MSQTTEDNKQAKVEGAGKGAGKGAGAPQPAESQEQRWMKYGANVVLTSLIVLVLAGVAIWQGNKHRKRVDTTYSGVYSLKPQTLNIIQNLEKPVTLVCLYPQLKQEKDEVDKQDFRQPVIDLLEEYRQKGKNINVQVIDSVNEATKYNNWLKEVKEKYGGNYKAYEAALAEFPKTLDEIKKLADQEVEPIAKLLEKIDNGRIQVDDIQYRTLKLTFATVNKFPSFLDSVRQGIEEDTKQVEKDKRQIRDYSLQAAAVRSSMEGFSEQLDQLIKELGAVRSSMRMDAEVRTYAGQAVPKLEALKKMADGLLDKIKNLGPLKLDELRQKLTSRDENAAPESAVVVMSADDIKLVSFEEMWKSGETFGGSASERPKLRFSGEQRVTAAILSLTQPKKKVAFIRAGGPPLTNPMFAGDSEMGFMELADRLRAANFDVLEKDVTGQWAMQAMQRQMPMPPEPGDEELKDAIWIVLSLQPAMGQMGPNPMGPRLKEHLDSGGSALVMFMPRTDDLSAALNDRGIEVHTDAIALHEPIKGAAGAVEDFIERARREPQIFVLNQYGDNPIAASLQTLDCAVPYPVVVKSKATAGYKVSPLLPIPTTPRSWGERDLSSIGPRTTPRYDPGNGPNDDLPAPLFAGAASEKEGGKGRVVALGSVILGTDGIVRMPDQKLYDRYKIAVARFPGNGELVTNSVYWLAGMDKMMSLSPTAMDVSRVAPISNGVLNFWRIGVLLVVLPLLVIGAGIAVYVSRRD